MCFAKLGIVMSDESAVSANDFCDTSAIILICIELCHKPYDCALLVLLLLWCKSL